jgi:hypothetical protein
VGATGAALGVGVGVAVGVAVGVGDAEGVGVGVGVGVGDAVGVGDGVLPSLEGSLLLHPTRSRAASRNGIWMESFIGHLWERNITVHLF